MSADKERQWTKHTHNAASHWIYVRDEATAQVVGGVEWLLFEENPFKGETRLQLDEMPAGDARDFTEHIANQVYMPRMQWLQKPHAGKAIASDYSGSIDGRFVLGIALNNMVVDVNYRNLGIGGMLMKWGIQRADQMGLESLIEASPAGRWLYEKYGYKFVMAVAMDTETRNPSMTWSWYASLFGRASFHVMWRPRKGDERLAPWVKE